MSDDVRRFLFFAGSLRRASLNKRLARHASELAVGHGMDARFLDLADYPMPIYDGDYEAEHSLPENARALKRLFAEADGFFLASPEYNGSFSPLLKNTLDWMSRRGDDPADAPSPFRGKVAGIAAASSGRLGGLRGLVPLRQLLTNLGVTVVPRQHALGGAPEKLPADGAPADEATREAIGAVLAAMSATRVG